LVLALAGAASGVAQEADPPAIPELDPHRYAPPVYDAPEAGAPAEAPAPEAESPADKARRAAARLDALYAELARPDQPGWEKVQTEIERLWSRSGSPAMDLLLRRAGRALAAEDYAAAIDHLTALTELAPDFAEGWNARATAFYQIGELSLAMADIEHVLALDPRHYGALTGLGVILDQVNQPAAALRALQEAERINPNRPDIQESIKRVERSLGAQDL
jgi:tetratricopeptide (TPR) repeat protein